jgi:hypothetical protein
VIVVVGNEDGYPNCEDYVSYSMFVTYSSTTYVPVVGNGDAEEVQLLLDAPSPTDTLHVSKTRGCDLTSVSLLQFAEA